MSKVYVLYDGRAAGGDTDRASVLEAFTNRFAHGDFNFWRGYDAVLFKYKNVNGVLEGECKVGHLDEGWEALKAKL